MVKVAGLGNQCGLQEVVHQGFEPLLLDKLGNTLMVNLVAVQPLDEGSNPSNPTNLKR